ncbi:MAG TPA: flagellar assembly protein FliH [Steroidobacteraceae bacterium]|nr:flagellar assembly protein FliH [Steroidobacteraceae bacterium]
MSSRPSLLNNDSASAWSMPAVDGPSVVSRQQKLTVSQLEQIERAAFEEAYAKGHAAGLAAAQAEEQMKLDQLTQKLARVDGMLNTLARPLAEMDAEVERELLALASTLAKHLVRRELKTDPGQIVGVIRETVALLPVATRDVRVHLHPEDAALVREKLAAPQAERAWTIVEDPVLTRGGCRVTTDTAQIDARVESRLGAVMSAMLGDERVTGEGVA